MDLHHSYPASADRVAYDQARNSFLRRHKHYLYSQTIPTEEKQHETEGTIHAITNLTTLITPPNTNA